MAHRLATEGETVLNVPVKLSARERALGGGSGRKTDDTDAYAVAVAGLRGRDLELVRPDDVGTVLDLMSDRHQQLVEQRSRRVNRLHQQLQYLLPGRASRRLTAAKAGSCWHPCGRETAAARSAGSSRFEHIEDLEALDKRIERAGKDLAAVSSEHPSAAPDIRDLEPARLPSSRPRPATSGACRPRARFASCTGTAPLDASSGDNHRHRLNRGGDRRLDFALHVCASCRCAHRGPGPGRDCYLRKLAAGKTLLEAMRCLERRLSDVAFRALLDDLAERESTANPGGHSGASLRSSASGPTPAASPSRTSHFPDLRYTTLRAPEALSARARLTVPRLPPQPGHAPVLIRRVRMLQAGPR